jgi:tetratricopeptide (TPR) repeat protein
MSGVDDDTQPADTTMVTPMATTARLDLQEEQPHRYTHRKVIARGGMGQVATAFDRKLGRVVAIKEVRGGHPDLVARFEREISLTARLEHPSIVTIHDAGRWPDGEPFYAMRLVPGRSLEAILREADTAARRLALVPHALAVADALAYAHQQHVMHRDLKPANVMVGEFGETVVIDWGLAKVMTATRMSTSDILGPSGSAETESGSVLGTPAYMPPEQARGEPTDERADVYAIGAVLYQMLAGRPPYEGQVEEVIEMVKLGPPPALADPELPRDLVAIVERAMARQLKERYPSAKQLAEDLRAFLAGRLVEAHRYSARERLARWVRKHRAAVGVGAFALLALLGVATVSIVRIVDAREVAERERLTALHHRAQAEDLLDFILSDLRGKLGATGQLDVLEAAMDKAREYYVGREEVSSRVDRMRLAEFHEGLAAVQLVKADPKAALAEANAALVTLVGLPPEDIEIRRRTIEGHMLAGNALRFEGNVDGALREFRAALAIVDSTGDRPDQSAGIAHSEIGQILAQRGDLAGARAEYESNLAIQLRIAQATPSALNRHVLADAYERLGLLESMQDHKEAARNQFKTMLDVSSTGEPTPELAATIAAAHTHLGDAYADDDPAVALTEYRAALARYEQIAADNPRDGRARDNVVRTELEIGDVLHDQKDAAALEHFNRAVTLATPWAAEHPDDVETQEDLAYALTHRGLALMHRDARQSLADTRAALAIHDRLCARDASARRRFERARARVGLGEALVAADDREAGRATLIAARDEIAQLLREVPDDAEFREEASYIAEVLATHRWE